MAYITKQPTDNTIPVWKFSIYEEFTDWYKGFRDFTFIHIGFEFNDYYKDVYFSILGIKLSLIYYGKQDKEKIK